LVLGVSSSDVKALQQILNSDPDTLIAASGVGSPGQETNYFGPATKKAVGKFQQKHGLAKPGDEGYGNVGPKTRAKLNEISAGVSVPSVVTPAVPSVASSVIISGSISRRLSKGISHADVRILQQILNSDPDTQVSNSGAGSPGDETTLFGPATERAVKKFQEKHGIAGPGDDGYGSVGPKTRARINQLLNSSASVPSASPSSAPAQSSANNADVAKQLDDSLKLLNALQEQLKTLK
ncbi:MAG: peptidoglycan-binding protein, partial [Candidatus Woesearchaeota archaeon]|nr:peptidoglycan-binding protein [Candidatus Woesearchaeota archaeon]